MSTSSAQLRRIAARYSAALFDLATEKKQLDTVQSDLNNIKVAVEASDEFDRLLTSPAIAREDLVKAVDAVLASLKADELTREFFRVLAENRRLDVTLFVVEQFSNLLMESRNEAVATVTVAYPLNDKQIDALKASIKKSSGRKDVHVVQKENPEILGGVIVNVDGKMFDNSIAGKITRLSTSLKAGVSAN